MLRELVALHQDATFQMIRQPECATVMEEKEREVIQLQRELMEAHATIGRLQAKLDGGERRVRTSRTSLTPTRLSRGRRRAL